MEPVTTPDKTHTSQARVRYEKLERAYLELLRELEALEKESKPLRAQTQAVIDKEKMKTLLEKILAE